MIQTLSLLITTSLLISACGVPTPPPCAPTNDLEVKINPKMCHESETQPGNNELVLLACVVDNPYLEMQAAGVFMLRTHWRRWARIPPEKPKATP